MTNTHDAEKVKRLVSISAITFDALKGFVMNLEKLPEWQKSALPDEFDNACDLLLFVGLELGAVLVEFDAVERISEVEE